MCKDNKHKDFKLIHEHNFTEIHKIELSRGKILCYEKYEKYERMKMKIMVY